MKKIALATVALAAFSAAQAHALEVEMFGQVNKAVMVYDDKKDTEFGIGNQS